MSATKHTPGPWTTNGFNIFGPPDNRSQHANGLTLVGGVVDDANDWRNRPVGDPINRAEFREEREANARLVAAAPELLAALEGLVDRFVGHTDTDDAAILAALAAIAKAEGRT